ncbi:hypothetical protein BH23ACT12_BH23ACT12_10990 [soil metagenome]
MLLGHWIEMRALGRAQGALAALAALLPDKAERIMIRRDRYGIPAGASAGGRCAGASRRPGPADGVITEGEAELDESMVTGESRPVARKAGDKVVAGTISTDSSIRVRAQAVGKNTALAGIQLSKASYRKMLQNLVWGAGYNLAAIPVAAGALAFRGITLSPAMAAVLMSASTVVVALNAQLLRRLELSRASVAGRPHART